MALRLRPVRLSDEAAFRQGHAAMWESDGFTFGLDYHEAEPFEVFVERHANTAIGVGLRHGYVPATFLVAIAGDDLVGRVSIRHELNDFLAAEGGHIGYGVLEDHRHRGYATEMLEQSLIVARSLGIDRALLICDDSNAQSARVIERCGGQLAEIAESEDGTPIRRYWIPL